MPRLSGIMAAAQIRQKYDTPIVFLTAYSGESDKVMGFSVGAAPLVFVLLATLSLHLVDGYFQEAAQYTENQVITAQMWTLNSCAAAALVFFIGLFLFLPGQKLSYIRSITEGVAALQQHRTDCPVPVEGRNELTELAETINYLSARELELRRKEEALQQQREQLIRALSHDIRTPLTSILSYTEYLTAHPDCGASQRQEDLALMDRKARQIRQLTDILLDGGNRSPEHFDDARLLWQQLAEQMTAELEDDFPFTARVDCPAFGGTFVLAGLSLFLAYGGVYIGLSGFPVQTAVGVIAGIAAIVSVVLELAGKNEKSGKYARILSVAGLVLGLAAAFFI